MVFDIRFKVMRGLYAIVDADVVTPNRSP